MQISDIIDDEYVGPVLYNILYEDGDCEDLNKVEYSVVIDLHRKLESGEIKEWEIGGDE